MNQLLDLGRKTEYQRSTDDSSLFRGGQTGFPLFSNKQDFLKKILTKTKIVRVKLHEKVRGKSYITFDSRNFFLTSREINRRRIFPF